MNNLSELQGELHKLSTALDALSRQVEDLKPRETTETVDFAALEALARQDPIRNPALAKTGEFEQDRYLRLASTAAFLTDGGQLDKLLYLCRLSAGSGCGQDAAQLQRMAYDTERLDWQSAAGELKALALPLLLDMMMLGNMAGPADERTLDFIASVAELLGVGEEDAAVVAQLAAVLLEQDEDAFGKIETKRAYPELGYLVPEEWLEFMRNPLETYFAIESRDEQCTHTFWPRKYSWPANIFAKERVDSGSFVKKGDILVAFKREFVDKANQEFFVFESPPPKDILATESGVVIFDEIDISTGIKDVWITSPFDSKEAFIKWGQTEAN